MRRNSVLLELSLSLDPVIQADMAMTQCCKNEKNRVLGHFCAHTG